MSYKILKHTRTFDKYNNIIEDINETIDSFDDHQDALIHFRIIVRKSIGLMMYKNKPNNSISEYFDYEDHVAIRCNNDRIELILMPSNLVM